jgi:HNH endonuclease
MTLPKPFAYPPRPHARKHGPIGYTNYQEYKDWLRDDFVFRCVYCLFRELWFPNRHAAFSVDHVLPQASHPQLVCNYDNLAYACQRCNSLKQDLLALDPTAVALADHLRVGATGTVKARTPEGQEFIDLFHLNAPAVCTERQAKLDLIALKRDYPADPRVDRLFRLEFGYPTELPDLAAKRPESNGRTEGLKDTHFRRQAEGRLGSVY